MDTDSEAYNLGWRHGYDDLQPDCPYAYGSKEYEEYYAGYEQGSNDC